MLNVSGCTFTLPASIKLVKVFISGCENCTFNVHCQLLTSHVEISHCQKLKVNVKVPLATLQVIFGFVRLELPVMFSFTHLGIG
jgi:hypothetical protein